MEILGGGPGSEDDARPDRDERGRKPEGQGGTGQRRRQVAASLDLGTMDLAPGVPSVYGRPSAPAPAGASPVVPHAAPLPVPPRPGAPHRPSDDDDVWTALRASAAASPGGIGHSGGLGAVYGATSGPVGGPAGPAPGGAGRPGDALDGGPLGTADGASDDAWPDGAQPTDHAPHERDYRADLMASVFSAPSLALAGFAILAAGLTGGASTMMLYAELASSPADAAPKLIAKALAAVGLLSAVLAFTSLRRMRATTPRWVATVAGATILVAVIMLCAAGYFWWSASAIGVETSIE